MAVLQSLKSPWKRKGKKRKKCYCNTGYSYLVTHPSTNLAEQDLTLLNRRKMLLSFWYRDFLIFVFLYFFPSLLSQPCSIGCVLSIPFLILQILKKCVQRRVTKPQATCFVGSTKLSPVRRA